MQILSDHLNNKDKVFGFSFFGAALTLRQPRFYFQTTDFFNLNFFMGAFLKWQNFVPDNERFFQFANVF